MFKVCISECERTKRHFNSVANLENWLSLKAL